jgi:hypothetical protein
MWLSSYIRCTVGGCKYGFNREFLGDIYVYECLDEVRKVI